MGCQECGGLLGTHVQQCKLKDAKTRCCGKSAEAVFWNPYNEAFQCHHCGVEYLPRAIVEGA